MLLRLQIDRSKTPWVVAFWCAAQAHSTTHCIKTTAFALWQHWAIAGQLLATTCCSLCTPPTAALDSRRHNSWYTTFADFKSDDCTRQALEPLLKVHPVWFCFVPSSLHVYQRSATCSSVKVLQIFAVSFAMFTD